MGMIGRWIDSLTDEQRDGIIEHPDPSYDGTCWWDDERGCGCLTGSAARGERWVTGMLLPGSDFRAPARTLRTQPEFDKTWHRVSFQFPRLARRFTPERMWRVCKARAARRNRVEIPAPAPEAVEVGA